MMRGYCRVMKIVTELIKAKDVIKYEPFGGIDGYFDYQTYQRLLNLLHVASGSISIFGLPPFGIQAALLSAYSCLLYTSPRPRDS